MSHMDIAERRLPQDGRMNLHANNQEIDVRVSTIPTVNGESISLRLLARGGQQFGFQRLDLSERQENVIRRLLAQPNGIILRSEEHTSELQSRGHLVCRLLL